jgi:ABC-type amino acid transport substrate-binding protein
MPVYTRNIPPDRDRYAQMPAVLLSLMTWTATAGALTLTDEERSLAGAHPQLRLGVDASWPPFEFRDQEGRYQGWPPITSP